VNTEEKTEPRETKHRRRKQSPQERRNGGTPVGHSGRIALKREQCHITPESRNSEISGDVHC
jgi:hypothetical protein